ncbi:MAG TPA: ABC transporter ATP-binding protein [Candidatus Baltobacteraceae bacterium]|jgi:ATP-binding cassette, subfamily B, bacterial MsbA|nr:ABC transporter ATP-binding protein [Candidatus Baltobacteraceae bacterium]
MMNDTPQMNERDEIGRLLRYLRPYTTLLALGILLIAVMGVAELIVALAIKPALDVILNPHSTVQKLALFTIPGTQYVVNLNSFVPHRIHHVWSVFAVSLLFLFLIKGLAEYFGSTLIQYVGLAGITDLRNTVYSKIVQQPVGFFQHNPVGRVMSAVISDIEQMRAAFSDWMAELFRQIFSLIAYVLVLVVIDWRMAVGAAVLIPLVVWPTSKLGKRIRRSSEKSRSRLADLSQILQETISGNRVVKAFGMEGFEIRKFREAGRNLLRENMRWIRAFAATSPLMDLLGAVVISLVLLFARGEIKADRMTIGAFGAFTFALFKAYEPIKRIGTVYQLFLQAIGISTQVFAFIDRPEEIIDEPGANVLPPLSKSVEFDRASFAYDSGPQILRNIDLKVPAGAVVAIVGSSGAGKTTLVNLLPRFYAATTGALRIDGHDVRNVTLRSLREQMAIVTQETILFNDTVRNNLCYGRPDMPDAKIVAAAQAALAHDFILQMPQGYQTLIGDRGQRLSGGQRQRLAIARALLKDAPILILDEATSELDSESEMLVQGALNNLMAGRTVFVIAHRLSTIRRADMIAVLEDGAIRERGTHEELLARGGIYARLYEMQFRDAETVPRSAGAE